MNTFLTPDIIAREALMVLRNNAVMANLIHRDYSDEFAAVGDTITIRNPAKFVANEFTGEIEVQDATEGSVEVKMDKHRELLASCYRSCLKQADENNLESIAFCCISTGEFHFPNEEAAIIALREVRQFRQQGGRCNVIFNVFGDQDRAIYDRLLKREGS